MLLTRTARLAALLVLAVVGSAGPALAGPPLICHPFEAENAPRLSWGSGSGWNSADGSYDVRRLRADTLRLLTDDMPTLARMENLRRATIYALADPVVAKSLLESIMNRAVAGGSARAWFDAGYLLEAYRQGVHLRARSTAPGGWAAVDEMLEVDGYGFVKKAMLLAGAPPEMEYAASLMTEGAAASSHRQRALAAAPRGSLLAKNLADW